MPELHESWVRAWNGVGAKTDGDDTYEALIARYSEPHRKYHTLQHLRECLGLFESVQSLSPKAAEIEMALWFHDAVYDVERSDNEERSAKWARTALAGEGVASYVVERIHSLVMATKHTGVPAGADEQLLVDIDLSILGAREQRFSEYERQIREEYSRVPREIFERRRAVILRSFLDRPRIYSTSHFHGLFEAAARENLRLAIGKNACR